MEKSPTDKKAPKKGQIQKIIDVTTPSQVVCLILTLALFSYIPECVSSAKTYKRYRVLEMPNYDGESLGDFWMVIPWSLVIRAVKVLINRITYAYFRGKIQHKYTGEVLNSKIMKCSKGVFKVFYFSFTFCFGLFGVLRQTNFAPSIMFGSGELMYTFGQWPYTIMPSGLKFYYMLSFSYYVEDGIIHIFSTPNYDYWEMVLHHTLTAMLIFSSYMNGFWNIGIFVLIQMDNADIWVGAIRAVMDYGNPLLSAFFYSGIMVSWVYFRFFAYVYWVMATFSTSGRLSTDNNTDVLPLTNILLIVLLWLNFYWFVLLAKMGVHIVKRKPKDLQNVVTKKDLQD